MFLVSMGLTDLRNGFTVIREIISGTHDWYKYTDLGSNWIFIQKSTAKLFVDDK